jgi:hypothetical protein
VIVRFETVREPPVDTVKTRRALFPLMLKPGAAAPSMLSAPPLARAMKAVGPNSPKIAF